MLLFLFVLVRCLGAGIFLAAEACSTSPVILGSALCVLANGSIKGSVDSAAVVREDGLDAIGASGGWLSVSNVSEKARGLARRKHLCFLRVIQELESD